MDAVGNAGRADSDSGTDDGLELINRSSGLPTRSPGSSDASPIAPLRALGIAAMCLRLDALQSPGQEGDQLVDDRRAGAGSTHGEDLAV